MRLGTAELMIILTIVVLIFDVGRIGMVGGKLGRGIRAYREGLKGDEVVETEELPSRFTLILPRPYLSVFIVEALPHQIY